MRADTSGLSSPPPGLSSISASAVPAGDLDATVRRGAALTNDWRTGAACVGADLEMFFPLGDQATHNELSAKAKNVCGTCPVLASCRAWSLKIGPEFGIFGGLTAHERRLVREGRWNGEQPRRRERAS